ncbi:DUF4192 family protein [Nonomuraea polychroma]|uniref:DUF4192 family protein n=1 Tax=Nonomuraea polychroma TaxID=46176 RepID=UPI003D8B5DCE
MHPASQHRLNDPGQFLALLPKLRGHDPADELLIVLRKGPILTAVIPLQLPITVITPELSLQLAAMLADLDADRYVLVGYGNAHTVDEAIDRIRPHLDATLQADLLIRVDSGRYYVRECPPRCGCPQRCTPGGQPLPTPDDASDDLRQHEQQVADELEPISGADRRASDYETLLACLDVLAAYGGSHGNPIDVGALVDDARHRVKAAPTLARQRTPSDRDIARLALALHIASVRDEALAHTAAAISAGDPDHVNAHVNVWRDVMRRTHGTLTAQAAGVYAAAAYAAGKPAHAAAAAAVAHDLNPSCELGHLMLHIIDRGVPANVVLAETTASIAELRAKAGEPALEWLADLVAAIVGVVRTFPLHDMRAAARLVLSYPLQRELEPRPS